MLFSQKFIKYLWSQQYTYIFVRNNSWAVFIFFRFRKGRRKRIGKHSLCYLKGHFFISKIVFSFLNIPWFCAFSDHHNGIHRSQSWTVSTSICFLHLIELLRIRRQVMWFVLSMVKGPMPQSITLRWFSRFKHGSASRVRWRAMKLTSSRKSTSNDQIIVERMDCMKREKEDRGKTLSSPTIYKWPHL